MRSAVARQRKPCTQKHSSDDTDDALLPLHRRPVSSKKSRRAQKKRISVRRPAFLLASFLVLIVLILLVIDRSWVKYSLSSFPRYHRLKLVNPTIPIQNAKIAIVSIHKGWKYHGSLGSFLTDNKISYANLHSYAYTDAFPDEKDLIPLRRPEMRLHNRPVYYQKPRFLLHLMEQHLQLEWLLWIDGDAIITHHFVSVEQRIGEFQKLHHSGTKRTTSDDLCLVWANDAMPNAGVLLVRNNPTSRALLRSALDTWEETDTFRSFTDQASLAATIQQNKTYQDCSLLLSGDQKVLLQSRVRGAVNGLWKADHWMLHLPNHNYIELLSSLKTVGMKLRASPPPVFEPLERPSTESLSTIRKNRFTMVQEAIRHAWGGYSKTCLQQSSSAKHHKVLGSHVPCDDLSPLSGVGLDWLYHAATLHDSLDTLAIAFGTDSNEYREGLEFILQQDLQATALRPTKTFEYSLRIVGGLLGAFSVSGDGRLLARAKDAADSLLQSPFKSSPTDLPRMFDVLFPPRGGNLFYWAYSRLYEWGRDTFTKEHHFNSLAGVGSFSLEFHYLSQVLGDEKYGSLADRIFRHVSRYQDADGIVPSGWNVMTGEPLQWKGGLGSGSDSFVEYLLKVPLLHCNADANLSSCVQGHPVLLDMLALYEKVVKSSLRSKHVVVRKESDGSIAYPVDNLHYHQLLCFLPGMVALGTDAMKDGDGFKDLALAEQLLKGCNDMYQQSATGLGPEEAIFVNQAGGALPKSPKNHSYLLRPEYIESLFIMYRLTGNDHYQEMGWKVFENLEHYCKTETGYAGFKDVNDPDSGNIDDMPSYFIAESLKYLLLLFGPDDFLSLKDFVMTTEAHPLRRVHANEKMSAFAQYLKAELLDDAYVVPAPITPSMIVIFLLPLLIVGLLILIVHRRMACHGSASRNLAPKLRII